MSEDLRDGGRNDLYAPDSDWDSDPETAREYIIMSGEIHSIMVNDWLDVQEGVLPLDPLWGCSVQVISTENDAYIQVRVYSSEDDRYNITNLDPSYVYNVYRRVQAV